MSAMGIDDATIRRWVQGGYLFRVLPGVYAVGHLATSQDAALFTAVLYAGPGAGLDGLTAGVWRGIVKWRKPIAIEVATPRRCKSLAANAAGTTLGERIAVRHWPAMERVSYNGIPIVPVPHIVRGLAATGDLAHVRIVLSQMDFMGILNEPELAQVCGRGAPGSAVLREALGRPQPLFARARSWFEIRMIRVCELTGLPMPEINEKIGGITPDAMWRDSMVVVECDGDKNHRTARQRRRDAADAMRLRALGFMVIRYTYDQLDDPWAIYADLMPILEERRGRAVA
jgi:very-short-patch-repair endonuclease